MRLKSFLLLTVGVLAALQAETVEAITPPAKVAEQVDRLLRAQWEAEGIKPAQRSSDSEFVRRLTLDLTGAIPREDRVREFLAEKGNAKRSALLQELLARRTTARFTSLRWAYTLVGREALFRSLGVSQLMKRAGMIGPDAAPAGTMSGDMGGDMPGDEDLDSDRPVPPLVEWMEERWLQGTPWSEVSRELIAAEGELLNTPQGQYMFQFRQGKAAEAAGSVIRVFQGIQIQCAQCHDHPYTEWSQEDFWGVAAFFGRMNVRYVGDKNARPRRFEIFERPGGQTRIPAAPGERGRLALPRFLDDTVISPGNGVHRRQELAELVTADDNPYFAKAMVNRVWSFYFGDGLTSPVDDLESTECVSPEVLELLAQDFKASGYDMRRLTEIVLSTEAYNLSSAGPEEGRAQAVASFARAPLRGLSAEQLFFSVYEATGIEDIETTNVRKQRALMRQRFALLRKFIQTFGDDEAEEVVDTGTIPQALMMLNGPLSNDAVRARPDHPLYSRLFAMTDVDDRIDTIYLRVLSRFPSKHERKVVKQLLKQNKTAKDQAQIYADVIWTLLNSSEFAFAH
ncbi:MAG: DUF1553 domain-containing protein [Planctomycetes bacterium]|nr:DUF1553 domain-containing protein [Planctomycetota bacterium]